METEKKNQETKEILEETAIEEEEFESYEDEDELDDDEELDDDDDDIEMLEASQSKTKLYILGGIIAIVAVVICLILLVPKGSNNTDITPGNNNNNNASPEEKFVTEKTDFKSIAESYGYIVEDRTKDVSVDGAEAILCAVEKNENYQIEYFAFKDADSAKVHYDSCKSELEEVASLEEADGIEPEIIEDPDYQKYTITTNESLLTVIRKKDTVLYVNYSIQYKEESSAFLDEIGGY